MRSSQKTKTLTSVILKKEVRPKRNVALPELSSVLELINVTNVKIFKMLAYLYEWCDYKKKQNTYKCREAWPPKFAINILSQLNASYLSEFVMGKGAKRKMLNAETWYTVRFFRITYFEWILDIYWNCYVHISLPKKLKKQLSSLENEQPRL